MDFQKVEDYITKLPYNEPYFDLPLEVREKIAFGSSEMLKRRYAAEYITDEIIGVQALYVAEGETEEFAKFKRQGVTSISLTGLSLSVSGSQVSPEIVALIEKAEADKAEEAQSGAVAFFGRLV